MRRRYRVLCTGLLVGLFGGSHTATAEIIDSARDGFSLRMVVEIDARPSEVYDSIVKDIGHWWDSAHTFSGNSLNLSLEDEPNGCFCESLDPVGGVQHGRVVFASRGKRLRLIGGLGPLQELAIVGTLSFDFQRHEDGTRLTMTYRVGGYHPEGLASLAPPVDAVLKVQLTRLESYIEKGKTESE